MEARTGCALNVFYSRLALSCTIFQRLSRLTLLEELLDLICVELLHRYVLWLGLSWCSCGACSLPLLGPPYVRRGRWHSLLPSRIVLGGGVCARVGVAVGLTLPSPAVSIVSMRKLPKLHMRLVSDVPIFTRATHLWYEATVEARRGRVEKI